LRKTALKSEPSQFIVGFAIFMRGQGKSQSTIESYCKDASQFLDYLNKDCLPIQHVNPEIISYFRIKLEHESEQNSVRRKIIGLRQFYRYLKLNDIINFSPLEDISIPIRNDNMKDDISNSTISSLMFRYISLNSDSLKDQRDAALLYLIGESGLKATEVCDLKWSDLRKFPKTVQLSISGPKKRIIELAHVTFELLERYQNCLNKAWATEHLAKDSKMFISFKGKDCQTTLPHITRHGVKFALREIGITNEIVSLGAERLRHYAIQNMLQSGSSAEQIAKHLGLRQLGNIAKHHRKMIQGLHDR
jgi:integrase/recombinase XerD